MDHTAPLSQTLIHCPTPGRIKSANRDASVLFGYPHTAFKEAKLAHLLQLAGGSHVGASSPSLANCQVHKLHGCQALLDLKCQLKECCVV